MYVVNATDDISSRPRTTSAVPWSPAEWSTVGEAGPDQRTSDIASIIAEIVYRPGWRVGNSLVVILTGTGKRVAEAFDSHQAGAALLHVEYASESINVPPAVEIAAPADGSTFTNRSCEGLLAMDVESGLSGGDGRKRMPMVGKRQLNRIQIAP